MYKNKWENDFPISSGLKVAEPILATPGPRQDQPWTRRSSVSAALTRKHSDGTA